MKCPECGADFAPTSGRQRFCTTAHQRAFWMLMMQRGRISAPFEAAAIDRHGDAELRTYARRELGLLAGIWAADDRAAGRRPSLIVAEKMAAKWRAVDLGR